MKGTDSDGMIRGGSDRDRRAASVGMAHGDKMTQTNPSRGLHGFGGVVFKLGLGGDTDSKRTRKGEGGDVFRADMEGPGGTRKEAL